MFRFEHTYYLWALLVLIPITLLFFLNLNKRKARLKSIGDLGLVNLLIGEYSAAASRWKFYLVLAGISFSILTIANPQIGSKYEEVKREGVELMICLDVSNSMLAADIQPNRLERAKQAISRLVDELGNDKIGLVIFAGKAYTQLPLTTDYAAAKLFLSTVNTDIVPVQGTAIGAALELGVASFGPNQASNRAIVVISDGENHEDDAIEQAKSAQDKGIKVHTIGIGSPQGAPIPIMSGDKIKGYREDENGQTILTKMNEQMMAEIAIAGGGSYTRATNASVGLDEILARISKMEKKEFGKKMFTDYEDRFQYFLAFAVFFLILELLISERKNNWMSKIKLFK